MGFTLHLSTEGVKCEEISEEAARAALTVVHGVVSAMRTNAIGQITVVIKLTGQDLRIITSTGENK